ncbi:zinc-binding dehydrogenase [Rhodococcus sp. WS4]|nr:zinc-binding dehydrogenase [Rhodococcus sp. WS4]
MPHMTAARLHTEHNELRLESVDVPDPSADEVRVKVKFAGVCLTDIHFLRGETAAGMPPQVTLGHEVSGVIDAVGSNVVGWRTGDRVVVHPVEDRGTTTRVLGAHYDGGWAEYLVAPKSALVAIADDVPYEIAAIIPDAVATPWAAITDTANVRPVEAVAVWGLGGLGYHAVKLLRLIGAAPIVAIDPIDSARERARTAGADLALDPESDDVAAEIDRITNGNGLDVAFDFYGSGAIHQSAFDALGRNGRLVLIGVPDGPLHVDTSPLLIRGAKRILGHYGAERRHIEELIRLVQTRRLDLADSVSAIYPLDKAHDALDALETKTGHPIRILLQP